MRCKKKAFPDEIAAELRISEIKKSDKQGKKEEKPKRAYKCPKCNQYHITCMDKAAFNKFMAARQEAQKKRIKRIAKHWEEKLKL